MNVLVACEYSGRVRDAFLRRGHFAMSCDFLPTESAGPHYQGDVLPLLSAFKWDLLIAHPPCTYLTIAAEWCYKDNPGKTMKPGVLFGEQRRRARQEAIDFVFHLRDSNIPRKVIENPIGILSTVWRLPDQIIQPNQFGHDASKATCLWVEGDLPLLSSTHEIPPRWVDNGKGKLLPRWGNQTDSGQNKLPPSKDRWKIRSETYSGIAEAMGDQYCRHILNQGASK